MGGHSKWATTKHKKAALDAKRGKLFAKLIKNIEVAARTGGGDPDANPTLYDAIQKAKKNSVPNDNIERARKRGAGEEAGGADWETIMYEGYGPGGVAVLIECLTDNRNRAASEVRIALTRNGGSLADPGSVSYMFNRKGVVTVPKEGTTEEDVMLAVLDAGAEEVNDLGDTFEVVSEAATWSRSATRWRTPESTTSRPRASSCRRQRPPRRGGRQEGVPPPGRTGGQGRRPGRLRQLRRLRRDPGHPGLPLLAPRAAIA